LGFNCSIKIAQQVSLGQMGCDGAISKISAMRWEEEATNVEPNRPAGVKKIEPYGVRCNKFSVPSNMSARDISFNYDFNLGGFSDVFAYTNSDGSKSITSLASNFMSY